MASMTAREMLSALYGHFTPRWAMLTEVTARPASGSRGLPAGRLRRIDVLLLRTGSVDDGIERYAIEVKVARPDFFSDVRCPDKQTPWHALAHRHAYAVPAGLIRADEVPAGSGLIVVHPAALGQRPAVEFVRRSKSHVPGRLPLPNIMDAFWRAGRAEAALKGIDSGAIDDDIEQMRAQVRRLERDAAAAERRAAAERERRLEWQRRYAAHEPPACATCGRPLHPTAAARSVDGWEHRDDVDAAACLLLRTAAAEEEFAGRPETQRWGRPVPWGPEPIESLAGVAS